GLHQPGILLDGHDARARFEQPLREAAQPRADLQDQVAPVDRGGLDHAPDDVLVRQEVLPQRLAGPKPVLPKQALDHRGAVKRLQPGTLPFVLSRSARAPSPRVDQGARMYTFTFRRPYRIASSYVSKPRSIR